MCSGPVSKRLGGRGFGVCVVGGAQDRDEELGLADHPCVGVDDLDPVAGEVEEELLARAVIAAVVEILGQRPVQAGISGRANVMAARGRGTGSSPRRRIRSRRGWPMRSTSRRRWRAPQRWTKTVEPGGGSPAESGGEIDRNPHRCPLRPVDKLFEARVDFLAGA